MAESLLASILHTLDRQCISSIAHGLGESETSVSRGMESSIATVLGGMAAKADDPGTLRNLLDLVPSTFREGSWSNVTGSLSNATSPWLSAGRRMLSGLFGNSEGAVTDAISRESGLGSGGVSSLLTMAAPMVLGLLGKKVRDEGLTMSGLGGILRRETSTIRSALPAGLSELVFARPAVAGQSPVIAQSVKPASSAPGWLGALALCAVALGVLWLFTHGRRPATGIANYATGTASRLAEEGGYVKRHLPDNVDLNVPSNGTESQLLGFVEERSPITDRNSWFTFDRLMFDSGSATLQPQSREQLDNIAAIFKAFPNVRAVVVGSTDNVGTSQSNLALSQARADNVKAQLVARGVPSECLRAQGIGQQGTAGENSTTSGRAENRRVILHVTQK
jgi:outer membrane protein OmpA-like peptidoglycan-associated protein